MSSSRGSPLLLIAAVAAIGAIAIALAYTSNNSNNNNSGGSDNDSSNAKNDVSGADGISQEKRDEAPAKKERTESDATPRMANTSDGEAEAAERETVEAAGTDAGAADALPSAPAPGEETAVHGETGVIPPEKKRSYAQVTRADTPPRAAASASENIEVSEKSQQDTTTSERDDAPASAAVASSPKPSTTRENTEYIGSVRSLPVRKSEEEPTAAAAGKQADAPAIADTAMTAPPGPSDAKSETVATAGKPNEVATIKKKKLRPKLTPTVTTATNTAAEEGGDLGFGDISLGATSKDGGAAASGEEHSKSMASAASAVSSMASLRKPTPPQSTSTAPKKSTMKPPTTAKTTSLKSVPKASSNISKESNNDIEPPTEGADYSKLATYWKYKDTKNEWSGNPSKSVSYSGSSNSLEDKGDIEEPIITEEKESNTEEGGECAPSAVLSDAAAGKEGAIQDNEQGDAAMDQDTALSSVSNTEEEVPIKEGVTVATEEVAVKVPRVEDLSAVAEVTLPEEDAEPKTEPQQVANDVSVVATPSAKDAVKETEQPASPVIAMMEETPLTSAEEEDAQLIIVPAASLSSHGGSSEGSNTSIESYVKIVKTQDGNAMTESELLSSSIASEEVVVGNAAADEVAANEVVIEASTPALDVVSKGEEGATSQTTITNTKEGKEKEAEDAAAMMDTVGNTEAADATASQPESSNDPEPVEASTEVTTAADSLPNTKPSNKKRNNKKKKKKGKKK